MKEKNTEYDGHNLLILEPENDRELDYLKNQNMSVIVGERGIAIGEMVTSSWFYKRLSKPNPKRIPVVMMTRSGPNVYDIVTSLDNL